MRSCVRRDPNEISNLLKQAQRTLESRKEFRRQSVRRPRPRRGRLFHYMLPEHTRISDTAVVVYIAERYNECVPLSTASKDSVVAVAEAAEGGDGHDDSDEGLMDLWRDARGGVRVGRLAGGAALLLCGH